MLNEVHFSISQSSNSSSTGNAAAHPCPKQANFRTKKRLDFKANTEPALIKYQANSRESELPQLKKKEEKNRWLYKPVSGIPLTYFPVATACIWASSHNPFNEAQRARSPLLFCVYRIYILCNAHNSIYSASAQLLPPQHGAPLCGFTCWLL